MIKYVSAWETTFETGVILVTAWKESDPENFKYAKTNYGEWSKADNGRLIAERLFNPWRNGELRTGGNL